MTTIEQLRAAGLTVHVKHERRVPGVPGVWRAGAIRKQLGIPPLPCGGKTTVRLVSADGREATGVAFCRPDENYVRSYGRDLALWRALVALAGGRSVNFVSRIAESVENAEGKRIRTFFLDDDSRTLVHGVRVTRVDASALSRDPYLYGNAFLERYPDGTGRRIDPNSIVIVRNGKDDDPIRFLLDGLGVDSLAELRRIVALGRTLRTLQLAFTAVGRL